MSPAQAVSDAITVSGSATYCQRTSMPPEAMLTVRIEDTSRADRPAQALAEVREVFGARQVPIGFALTVPRSAVDPRAVYTLRATINVGGELRFATTRRSAVPGAGADARVELVLEAVAPMPEVGTASASTSTAGLSLPATFAGVLPCADCVGVANTLTLRADGLYRLRRTYIGKPGDPTAEIGRWTVDASGQQITLGRGGTMQRFTVVGEEALRQLDRLGQPIQSAANLELRRTAQLDAIAELLRWRGEFVYLADAATFTDCASGLRWPVALTGDYLAAERRHVQTRSEPGAPLVLTFDGHLEVRAGIDGTVREHMVVDRLGGSESGATCNSAPVGQGSGSRSTGQP